MSFKVCQVDAEVPASKFENIMNGHHISRCSHLIELIMVLKSFSEKGHHTI